MSRFLIIPKGGGTARYSGCPSFTGTYMKPGMVEFREIASPVPIDWTVGDYIGYMSGSSVVNGYSRTGLRYSLYSVPQVKKQARSTEYGAAFVYQNVQFFDDSKQLEICPFRDLVPDDNRIHFSTQPAISTFEGVDGIARRIQACLDDMYPDTWVVRLATTEMGASQDLVDLMAEAREFTVSGVSLLGALDKVYEVWPDVGWVFTRELVTIDGTSVWRNVITIGGAGLNQPQSYQYGKGNGLKSITRNAANADEIATRIFAYGSSRNMLPRWYNKQTIKDAESVDIQNLMIPVSEWGLTEVDGVELPDPAKAFIDASSAIMTRLGLRPKTYYFDGTGDLPEIYPTIREMTIKDVRDSKSSSSDPYYPNTTIYPDGTARVDKIASAPVSFDSGLPGEISGIANLESDTLPISVNNTFTQLAGLTYYPFYHYQGSWSPGSSGTLSVSAILDLSGTVQMDGIESVKVSVKIKHPSYQGAVVFDREYELKKDGANSVSLSGIEFGSDKIRVDNVSYIVQIDFAVNNLAQQTDKTGTYSISGGFSFTLENYRTKTFKVGIRQIGFDINEQANLGEGKTIAMRSGKCAGRSFVIKNCNYVSSTDSWELEVIRSNDESLSQWFPNTDYPIAVNDEFVLLDIAMPDEYILVAEMRLLAAAQELLADVSVERWQYTPEIDAKFMVENDRTILPGQNMQLTDANVVDDSPVAILIDSVTINEGEAAIPTYKVTLRDRKKKTFTESKGADNISSNPVTNSTKDAISNLSASGGDSYFTLDGDGNVTLKEPYQNLWVPGFLAAGGIGNDNGGGGGGLITSVKGVADLGTPIVTESLTETFSAKAIESIYEAVQERATALSLTSGGSYLLDSDGKPLKDSNGNYLVVGGDSSKVLNLLNEAGEVISSVELPIPTIDSPFVTIGEATINLGGSASLTDIGVPGWAQDEELAFASLPSLYIGRTPVKSTGDTNDILLGINGFTSEGSSGVSGDESMVVWEPNGGGTGIGAWHFKGNIYADGWIAAGGAGEDESGYTSYLNNLEDVSVENLQIGDILQWDGVAYVNIPKSSIATLTNHSSHSTLVVGGNSVSFYDKEQVDLKIGAISPFDYIPVQTLPTADSTTVGKIYMLGPDSDNIYTLYYTKEESGSYSWVPFGTTEVNLSGYATTEELAQETNRVENYQQLVANGGVYRVKLDETKRIDESGMVQRRTNSDQNYAVLTEISVNDVYSISINTKYKYEFLWHAKSSLVTDQFTRAGVWLTGQTILSSLPFYENADRLRIRIYSEDSDGNPVVFATMVEDLNPVIRTWREILEPVPAQVEVLRSGSLVTPGAYPSNTRLFDTSIAKAGDIINYELNNTTPVGSYSQYFAIGFYNSEGTRLTYIGYDGTALSGAYTARGTVQIPEGFAYAAITDWGGMTIVSMTTNESLDAVYSKLNNTIQKNSLFDGDLSLEIVEGSDTTQNIGVADVPLDKGGLPEYLYIKCDAVSNLNLADYPLRFDCYKWVGLTLTRFAYRFYHKSNIGRYVKFDLPTDTDVVRLIASVTVDSTASAQNITYTGVKLSLAPSDKEFSISGTTFVREHDEYGRGTYDDEIDDTVDKIVTLSAKPCLVLNILTDTHENRQLRASVDITTMTLSNVKAVSKRAFSDGLVHMGDILAAGQSSQYLTWGEVNNHLSEYVGRLRELNEHCFVCVGNHDGLEGNYVDEAHTYGSLEQFNEDYVVRDGIAPWFYKDYDKIKTRVAFLAVPSRDCVANGSLRYGIGENQMRWIAGTVLGVPDGWNVLFFSHIHPYSGFEAGDATIFAGLTTAFCNRTTYSYNGDYSLSVDYSGRTSGKVVALVAGHTHADAVIDDATVFTSYNLSFPIIVNASSNRLVGGNQDPGYTNPTRIENTISEDLWDTLVYRPDLNKIFMVRFGAGSDREIDV